MDRRDSKGFLSLFGEKGTGCCVRYPLIREQRACFVRRFLVTAAWTAAIYAVTLGTIEFFYGPGIAFSDGHPYLMGGISAVLMVALLVATGYFIGGLVDLLRFPARLKKSAARYLPEGRKEEVPELLEKDIRRQWYNRVLALWMGEEWLVFPGQAMKRDAIVGIYQEDFSRRYFSKKMRLTVVDENGEEMSITGPKDAIDHTYGYLINSHATISWGDKRELTAFRLREQSQNGDQVDHRKLRRPPYEELTDLGVCKWDQSPILEDNRILSRYERWLLAAYAPYIAGGSHFDGDFDHAGGYPCTKRQRRLAIQILKDPWDIHGTGTLIHTLNHLLVTGKEGRDGWQLGRAMMVLGYGYIAGYIARWQLLDYSLPVARAIQQCFPDWKGLHDTYMSSFRRWCKEGDIRRARELAYRELLRDPQSILNTVPFNLNLESAQEEAINLIGGRPEMEDDYEDEDGYVDDEFFDDDDGEEAE